MLTQKDLDEIEGIIDEKLEEQLKLLPTKDEFFSSMDEVMGELKTMREELAITNHHLKGHEDRIKKLETIHPDNRHAAVPA